MISNESKTRRFRTLLGIAAAAVVAASFGTMTTAKADDDDWGHRGWQRDRHEDREEAREAWARHEWREDHAYRYGYYAPPRVYYTQPRVYYPPPPVYYTPQPYYYGG